VVGAKVRAILANPRYTGREVWNRRQATDRTGRSTVVGERVVSTAVTHPALVSEADFVAAQRVRAERAIGDGGRRRYLLRGLLRCGHCGRRMDSHWVHERAGYRCRHGHRSTASKPVDAPDNLYVREDAMLRGLAVRVALDDRDAAGATSPQDALEFLRSNAISCFAVFVDHVPAAAQAARTARVSCGVACSGHEPRNLAAMMTRRSLTAMSS
jgi:site-specific DNA recombinase